MNKKELITIVERLINRNDEQTNQLNDLNNKMIEYDNNLKLAEENKDKIEKKLQKQIEDLILEKNNLQKYIDDFNIKIIAILIILI